MSFPQLAHRPPHYRGNRLYSFAFRINRNGSPYDLTGGVAKCQLKNKKTGAVLFTFPESGDHAMSIEGNKVIFPTIDSWSPEAGIWSYDVKVTIGSVVLYFTNGDWPVIQNITE
jgi:hypothetical protein